MPRVAEAFQGTADFEEESTEDRSGEDETAGDNESYFDVASEQIEPTFRNLRIPGHTGPPGPSYRQQDYRRAGPNPQTIGFPRQSGEFFSGRPVTGGQEALEL